MLQNALQTQDEARFPPLATYLQNFWFILFHIVLYRHLPEYEQCLILVVKMFWFLSLLKPTWGSFHQSDHWTHSLEKVLKAWLAVTVLWWMWLWQKWRERICCVMPMAYQSNDEEHVRATELVHCCWVSMI